MRSASLVLLISALLTGCGAARDAGATIGDPGAGKNVITRQACGSCHTIPGLELANGLVGPPLTHFASRGMIAGALPNTRSNLVAFLRSPQSVVRGGAMPDMSLTSRQARDVAAYLLTLR